MAALLEFLQEYVEQLGELTSPVKAKINSLTMLAAEEAAANPAAAPSIAAAIEKRIHMAPATAKLPALFLLDSIAKNAKEPFIQIFSRNLPEVFLVAWDVCLADRGTLQRVLLTWDRIFPPQPLESIRQRAGLAPSLASDAPPAIVAAAGPAAAVAPQPAAQMAAQPPAASAALAALQAALLGSAAAAQRPPPMQREPASLRPVGHEQAPAVQPLPVPPTLPQPGPPQPAAAAAAGRGKLGADQIAALREAAAARLAAARAPKPQPQQHRGQPRPQAQHQGPHQQALPAAVSGRGREYEPTMPGAAAGGNALHPEQMSQLEALLKSLAQGTSSLPAGNAPVQPAAPANSRPPSADELWSPAVLKERNPAAVDALLKSSEALLPAQLDRAFAAKRRARARGTAMASRTWFPSPSAWLAGAAPEADPGAAFGQQAEAAEEVPVMQSVAADDAQTQCALSGEKFETFWDDELQQWRYKDARRLDAAEAARYGVPEGAIVLVSALSAADPQLEAAAPVLTADDDGGAGAALEAAVQDEAAAADVVGNLAGDTSLAASAAEVDTEAAAPGNLPIEDGPSAGADVKAEPEQLDQLRAGASTGSVHEAGTGTAAPDPEAAMGADGSSQAALHPSSGIAGASADDAQQVVVGRKRPLDEGPAGAADGPMLAKVKREAL